MKNYPDRYRELVKLMGDLGQEIPGTMKAFGAMHKAALKDGALSKKNKELISLGIAIAVRCDGCIAFHVHDSLKAGASEAEIMETIGTTVMMGGGPSIMYGCEALAALKQFAEEEVAN